MKKDKEEKKILDKIKKLYQNYGIDMASMEEEEIERVYKFYTSNPEKLTEDLKSSGCHANTFSDVDIL